MQQVRRRLLKATCLGLACLTSTALALSSIWIGAAATASASSSTNNISINFIPSLFTATVTEYLQGKGTVWGQFTGQIDRTKIVACLKSQGYTLPAELPSTKPHAIVPENVTFPDLKRLKSGSWGSHVGPQVKTPNDMNSGIPSTVLAAWQQDEVSCEQKATATFANITKERAPLTKIWGSDLEALKSQPTVVAADGKFVSCVAAAGVTVKSVTDFFSYVQTVGQHGPDPSNPTSEPGVQAAARLYGNCYGPVVEAMDAVRLRDRAQILDKYAPQLRQLQENMTAMVEKLSKEYGLKVQK